MVLGFIENTCRYAASAIVFSQGPGWTIFCQNYMSKNSLTLHFVWTELKKEQVIMRFIQKFAVMSLSVAALAGTASLAHADPCLSLTGCLQQDAQDQLNATRDSVRNDANNLTSGFRNSGQAARDQVRNSWNNSTQATREQLQAQRDRVTNAEKNVRDRWNNSGEEAREKLQAQRDRVTNAEKSVRDRWNNSGEEARERLQAQRDRVTNAEKNVTDRWNNAGENTRKAWKAQKDRVSSDLRDATTLPPL